MLEIYLNAIGNHVTNAMQEHGAHVEHLCRQNKYWGVDYNILRNESISNISICTTLDYKYSTDYTVKKYFTEAETGDFHFWEYDYKSCFPISITPFVMIFGLDEEEVNNLKSRILSYLSTPRIIRVKHPLLQENLLLKCTTNDNPNVSGRKIDEKRYVVMIELKNFIVPLFNRNILASNSDNHDYNWNQYVAKQACALAGLWDKCRQLWNSGSITNEHDKQKFNQIYESRNHLLALSGIPKNMWDYDHIKAILDRVESQNKLIEDAVKSIISEENRQQEAESRRQEYHRAEEQQHIMENGRPNHNESGAAKEDRNNGGGHGSFLGNVAAAAIGSAIGNRGIKKELKRQREAEEARERERARESRRMRDEVIKANMERRKKGQPELPVPPLEY